MDEAALIQFLKENLRIRCEEYWSCDDRGFKIVILLKDVVIADDYYIP